MRKINLLPPAIQARRSRRKLLFMLVMCTAAMLLALVTAYQYTAIAETRNRQQSLVLSQQLSAVDYGLIEAYVTARDTNLLREHGLGIIQAQFPQHFDSAWLTAALEAVPLGITLHSLDFTDTLLTLTASAASLSDITVHTRLLSQSGYFEAVHLGAAVSLADGAVRYELRIIP
jgi:Tfp pilus assembly protein PilN